MKTYRTKLISVDRTNDTACVEFNIVEDDEVVYTCHHHTPIRPHPDLIRCATLECINNMAAAEHAARDRTEVYSYIDSMLGKTFEYTDEMVRLETKQWTRTAGNYDDRKALVVEVLIEMGLLK